MVSDTGVEAYVSLGADVNKKPVDGSLETKQGVVSPKMKVLELQMEDKDIVKLIKQWEKDWNESPKKTEWEKKGQENENYWEGKQFDNLKSDKSRPNVDNALFEALETYLPQATRRNPEAVVKIAASDTGANGEVDPTQSAYVEKVKQRLADLAERNNFRLKLKTSARHWAIFLLGVAKFGWDLDKNIPTFRIVRPTKIMLDPDATISEEGYTGERVGEIRKLTGEAIFAIAGKDLQDDAKKTLNDLLTKNGERDLATEIQFQEWWTPKYMCWRLGDDIIYKKKNPFWNYETEAAPIVDDFGTETPSGEVKEGINHFFSPKMPYEFLSVFQLGDRPFDATSLMGQNLANQDRVNKRNTQIEKNVDKMNGGAVVSLARSGLTEPQAKGVVRAIRKGGAILIPDGNPQEAVYFPTVPSLPADVFNERTDTRMRIRDIFGVSGSSQAGLSAEDTVRGKIVARTMDADRIGGGFSDYLEQYAGHIYNWLTQLLYVFDDGFQFVDGAIPPRILVSVKDGSLLPKDSISIANQALELAQMNRISTLDLYKRLEFPNPEEMAANVWLEANAPQLLYKDNLLVQEAMGMQAQAQEQARLAEEEKGLMDHSRGLEKQMVKTEGDMAREAARSVLSQVPQGP